MKPIPLILAAILVGIAALLVVFQQGHSERPVANRQPDAHVARKSRTHVQPSSEPLTIAEKVSRPSQTPSPQIDASDSSDSAAATSSEAESADSAEIHAASEMRKALRLESERHDEATGNHVVLQPAAWMDLGEDSMVSPEHQDGIQQIASELREKIADSGLDPSTPAYRRLWNDAVRESNWKFRARYGARAWTRHHIQAYHSSQAKAERN